MAKAKRKLNYDHFEKKGFKAGDAVLLDAEVNAMVPGTKGKIVDEKVLADGGAHHVKILTGPKHGTVVYILARDLVLDK